MKKISLIFVFVFLGLISFASAANIGVSPASLDFNNVLRGGYAEDHIFVSASVKGGIDVDVEPIGEIKDWINVSESFFKVEEGVPYDLGIYILPPADTPNGNYSGFLRVKTGIFQQGKENHLTGQVLSSIDLKIDVEIIDEEIINCGILNANIEAIEEGYASFLNMNLRNKGNIWISPDVLVDVWDRDQTEIVYSDTYRFDRILPTHEGSSLFEIDSRGFEVGQYFVEISVPKCLSEKFISFDVLEEGSLRANGIFTSLLSRGEGMVGEVVPLEASFKNVGEKSVSARFVGDILFENKIIETIETEKIEVPVGAVDRFSLRFVPEKQGKYLVKGQVYYDGKRTFEKENVINVYGSPTSIWFYVVVSFFMIGIVFLFYMLVKEKKIYRRRLRRL